MSKIVSLLVPDIGNRKPADIIDVVVKKGDVIAIGDTLITLETDKATMDVPAEQAGIITEINVKIGDKISTGGEILRLKIHEDTIKINSDKIQLTDDPTSTNGTIAIQTTQLSDIHANQESIDIVNTHTAIDHHMKVHAGPAVRKLARELGVDLLQVHGTAPKNRIVQEDLKHYIKQQLNTKESDRLSASNTLPCSDIDYSQFGQVEILPLSRIKQISGKNLHRNWTIIPHVTQHADADITDLEAFRQVLNQELQSEAIKISPLAFIMQVCAKALQKFPEVNSSLDGAQLVLKKYYHIGFAADTPNGLVVPVIKNVRQKGLKEIAQALTELSNKARSGKLTPLEMQGASFTISSLGGIGGNYFTPIINAPEVAILGVGRSNIQPVWDGSSFQPRLICPLSLSYDHRVIDGALACRFITYLSSLLSDYKRLTL